MNLLSYVKILRPTQWLKNLMLLFPPFLGGVILQPAVITKSFLPVVSFCLASSATYIFNDIMDKNNDANHPIKKYRPIPSGSISIPSALLVIVFILVAAIFSGFLISTKFLLYILIYLAVAIAYSLKLKELPLVDIFCISAGFLFRLEAGGEAFGVNISEWLFLSVFLLSIFLSTGKRLSEKNFLGSAAGHHRKALANYPAGFLEGTMYLTGATVLVTYTMYTLSKPLLVYTVPLCTFGLLRYILRVHSGHCGDPTESLMQDAPLFITGGLWACMVGWSIYG